MLLQEDNLVTLELLKQPSLHQQRVFEVQQGLGLRIGLDGVGGAQGLQGHSGDTQGSSLRLSPPHEPSQAQVATTARQGFAVLQDTASTFLASLFRQSQTSSASQSQVRPEPELPGPGQDHRSGLAGGLEGGLGGPKTRAQQSHVCRPKALDCSTNVEVSAVACSSWVTTFCNLACSSCVISLRASCSCSCGHPDLIRSL